MERTENLHKPIITIVGRPNVGKSTLFNRLIGQRKAITSDVPGTTRDRLYGVLELKKREVIIVDTAGIEKDLKDELAENIKLQIDLALEEAEIFIFVVDAKTGVMPQDIEAAEILRKQKKPVITVVNKTDNKELEKNSADFYSLGLGDIISLSSIHGFGVDDLIDQIEKEVKNLPPKENIFSEESDIVLALTGRPNVGKSSILNYFLGDKKVIVSKIPGTTRDINTAFFESEEKRVKVLDTAGLRKPGKIERGIEKYSALRTFKAVESSDITLIVIDGEDGIAAQDLHIAGMAKDLGKGLVIVVNKWDAVEKDDKTMSRYLAALQHKFDFTYWAPVVFVSAKTGKNMDKIAPIVNKVFEGQNITISTPKLNSFMEKITIKRPHGIKKGIKPKLFYGTQTGTKPPTFTFFSNYPELIHFSYLRYIENQMREEFGFEGTPIRIILKKRKQK
jgi:GTPase